MIISNFNIHQNDVIDVPNPTKRKPWGKDIHKNSPKAMCYYI